jgi:hypothetical protein
LTVSQSSSTMSTASRLGDVVVAVATLDDILLAGLRVDRVGAVTAVDAVQAGAAGDRVGPALALGRSVSLPPSMTSAPPPPPETFVDAAERVDRVGAAGADELSLLFVPVMSAAEATLVNAASARIASNAVIGAGRRCM